MDDAGPISKVDFGIVENMRVPKSRMQTESRFVDQWRNQDRKSKERQRLKEVAEKATKRAPGAECGRRINGLLARRQEAAEPG